MKSNDNLNYYNLNIIRENHITVILKHKTSILTVHFFKDNFTLCGKEDISSKIVKIQTSLKTLKIFFHN